MVHLLRSWFIDYKPYQYSPFRPLFLLIENTPHSNEVYVWGWCTNMFEDRSHKLICQEFRIINLVWNKTLQTLRCIITPLVWIRFRIDAALKGGCCLVVFFVGLLSGGSSINKTLHLQWTWQFAVIRHLVLDDFLFYDLSTRWVKTQRLISHLATSPACGVFPGSLGQI